MINKNQPCAQVLGMASVPMQQWTTIYDLCTGLKQGTIFPDLDKPFFLGGVQVGR